MKIGVNLWTVYGWNLPEAVASDVLETLAAMGSQGVELVIDEAHNSPEVLLSRRQELGALVERLGLEVPSMATTLFWRYNLASQKPDLRARGLQLIRDGCRVTQAFGARVFLVVAGQQEPRTDYDRTYETAVASLREGAQYASDLGVILGVENVRGSFLCSPGEYARFLADVDHPAVKAYLDFGNGMSVGPSFAENWVAAVKDRLVLVHAKDYDRGFDAYVCCGQGDVPWQDTVAALRDASYGDFVIVETPPRGGRDAPTRAAGLQAARTSVEWLAQYK